MLRIYDLRKHEHAHDELKQFDSADPEPYGRRPAHVRERWQEAADKATQWGAWERIQYTEMGARVPSFTNQQLVYEIPDATGWCNCAGVVVHRQVCKHMAAALLARGRTLADLPPAIALHPRATFDEHWLCQLAAGGDPLLAESQHIDFATKGGVVSRVRMHAPADFPPTEDADMRDGAFRLKVG